MRTSCWIVLLNQGESDSMFKFDEIDKGKRCDVGCEEIDDVMGNYVAGVI